MNDLITAALAQQAEPAQEPYTGDVTRIMRDAGMTFHLGLPHKAVVEQMTRVVDLVYAEASIKAAQQFSAALAQQAEPVEPVAWLRVIDEAMVTHHLGVADPGDDYETAKRKMNNLLCMAQDIGTYFAKQAEPVEPVAKCIDDICSEHFGRVEAFDYLPRDTLLYTAPPQRKPLTDEDIERIFMTYHSPRQAARAVERAHGIADPQIEDRLARHGIPMPGDPK